MLLRVVYTARNDEEDDLLIDWGSQPRYLYVSKVSLSPYELVLSPLTVTCSEDRLLANAADDELCFKANLECADNLDTPEIVVGIQMIWKLLQESCIICV